MTTWVSVFLSSAGRHRGGGSLGRLIRHGLDRSGLDHDWWVLRTTGPKPQRAGRCRAAQAGDERFAASAGWVGRQADQCLVGRDPGGLQHQLVGVLGAGVPAGPCVRNVKTVQVPSQSGSPVTTCWETQAKLVGSAKINPVSSWTSRVRASWASSPGSATPPGRTHCSASPGRRSRTINTEPSSSTMADTMVFEAFDTKPPFSDYVNDTSSWCKIPQIP